MSAFFLQFILNFYPKFSSDLTCEKYKWMSLNSYLRQWEEDAEDDEDGNGVESMQVEHEVVGQNVFRGKQLVANQIKIVHQRQSHVLQVQLMKKMMKWYRLWLDGN